MTPPIVKTQMLIRRPVAAVFAAFVDPAITSRFWFTRGSDRLVAGKHVRWDWEMYGASAEVDVKAVEHERRILVEWGGPANPTEVEWTFAPSGPDRTFVTIENRGFRGDPDKIVAAAIDSMGGFSLLLAGAKAFLEHGIDPHLVVDHHPEAIVAGWKS